MINKTYCFCNEHFCNLCKVCPDETEERTNFVTQKTPTDIQVEFDYTCNLSCPSCRSCVSVASPFRKHILDFVTPMFKNILDKTEWVRLAGYGDVFASKYYQELLYSNIKRKNLFLLTNGVLLTEEKFNKLIGKYENIEVHISIDAAYEETYRKMRPGGNWDKLQNNLEMLAEKKKEGYINYWSITFVTQTENYKEIPDFVKMGKRLGVSRCYFNNIRQWGQGFTVGGNGLGQVDQIRLRFAEYGEFGAFHRHLRRPGRRRPACQFAERGSRDPAAGRKRLQRGREPLAVGRGSGSRFRRVGRFAVGFLRTGAGRCADA